MRLGIVAYSTNTGLGVQTYNLYKYLKPTKVMLVDLFKLNGMETHHERFPGAQIVDGIPKNGDIDAFLVDLDVVFVCETPLNYYLFRRAKELGVKTVLQYNFELLDYFEQPKLPVPDVFAAPTWWRYNDVPFENKTYLPVPIETKDVPYRVSDGVKTFLHIQGRPAVEDRNGVCIFAEAARIIEEELPKRFQFIVRTQDRQVGQNLAYNAPWLKVSASDLPDSADLYKDGDVLVMPRKYGGLCLPVNEALARGMPVIMPDIEPNNRWLPDQWLVPAEKKGSVHTRLSIDLYECNARALANKMLELAAMQPRKDEDERPVIGQHFAAECKEARALAMQYSWEGMKHTYETFLEDLCRNPS